MRKKLSGKLRSDDSTSPVKQCRREEATDRVQVSQSLKRQNPKRVSMSPMSDKRLLGHEPGTGASSVITQSPRKLERKPPPVQNRGTSSIKSSIPRTLVTLSKRSSSTLKAPDQAPTLQNHPTDLNMASKSAPTRNGKRSSRAISFPKKMDLDASSHAVAPSSDRPTAPSISARPSSSISAMTPPQTSPQGGTSPVPSGQTTKQRPPVPCASPGGRRASLSASRSNHRRKTSSLIFDLDDPEDETKNDRPREQDIKPFAAL